MRSATSADHPLSAHLSAVPHDERQLCESGSLLAVDLAEFGYLGDQHRTSYWTDPRHGKQDGGGFGHDDIGCEDAFGYLFCPRDWAFQQLETFVEQYLDLVACAAKKIVIWADGRFCAGAPDANNI